MQLLDARLVDIYHESSNDSRTPPVDRGKVRD